ncbi:hypothetical protein HJFPF1_13620 [Paramyrothecium foliicola]|nr:hypothetical protein HJFPF1_13620 [Paramyrothecium foliicola]
MAQKAVPSKTILAEVNTFLNGLPSKTEWETLPPHSDKDISQLVDRVTLAKTPLSIRQNKDMLSLLQELTMSICNGIKQDGEDKYHLDISVLGVASYIAGKYGVGMAEMDALIKTFRKETGILITPSILRSGSKKQAQIEDLVARQCESDLAYQIIPRRK